MLNGTEARALIDRQEDTDMLNMSETIRKRRRELGMTQEQLAQRLGVSGPAVSKWEQGASYPDVTLLPALARALHTDMNALTGFVRAPDQAQIAQMLARVNETAKAEGIEAGMALARDLLAEYPDCGALLFGLAATLDGRMIMAGMTGEERAPYAAETNDWYTRAADSDDPEARLAASHLLAAAALNRGNPGAAEEMLSRLPEEREGPAASRWPLDLRLMLAKGERQEALRFLQSKLLMRAADMQQMLLSLVQLAAEAGDTGRAQALADTTQAFVQLLHMHPYTGHAAQLLPALARQDAAEALRQLRALLGALEAPWAPEESPLYDQSGVKKSEHVGRDMLAGMVRELEEDETYAFLRAEPGFTALLAAYRGASDPRG